MATGLSTKNAPSPSVVLPHFAFAALAFLASSVVMLLAASKLTLPYHLNPEMLALTHLMVLGFITMIIFGSLYQLIPVVMEVKLFSEMLARITFYLFGIGLLILVASFWKATFGGNQNWLWFEVSGTLILTAVILFAINTLKSAVKSDRMDMGNIFIITAIIYLILTVSIAILLIINFARPFIPVNVIDLLKMHVNLGLMGWFLFLIIGVSSKLMPMFLIIHKLPDYLLKYTYYLLNTGIILLVGIFYFYPHSWAVIVSTIPIFAGIGLYLRFNYYAFQHRFRKNLDAGMKLSKAAFIILSFTLLLGLFAVISPRFTAAFQYRIDIAFVMSFIFGFLSALILGQTYKTLPFIVWLQKYQAKVGKQKIPLPQELYSNRIANIHNQTFLVAFVFLITGELTNQVWLIRSAAALFIITAVLYNYNVFKIVFHKEKIIENE
ncbi:MAG: hypothetical protein IEMM0006_0860 [bacterium]|nr:MAG: hypothetical protein IEMM0006_0860 [bacterium]